MILVDANIFMYAAGKPSPQRSSCRGFLERVVRGDEHAGVSTDAEVLQEILHRYRVLGVPGTGTALFNSVVDLGLPILPVTEGALQVARSLIEEAPRLSTRDVVHLGVMRAHGISRILSYDRAFDGLPSVDRLEP